MPKKQESQKFEELIEELESVMKRLENGECELEESLKLFEQGVSLYKSCKSIMAKAEKKVQVLTESLKEESLDV